ncbi:M15 family metallopeptidase [Sphingomonas sp. PL-96]|uniref:M15 family metallopeptidase n=1 Tax=Sphingomonas sp. PL-96 TaxID=2887201 RepID=UPI001E3F9C05|nr:M15 family metallopeptidase [Sphingomonas sp. PL-96]MCC2975577.1 M15 family metallopeptidase [Sphingomonas sp. PL-96]
MRHSLRMSAALVLALAACQAPKPVPVEPPVVPAPVQPLAPPPPPPAVAVNRAPIALCERGVVQPGPDGRLFNHFPYPDTTETALIAAPADFSSDGSCRIHPAMLADLQALLARANMDPAVAGKIRAVSCHRSIRLQRQTFCGGINPDESNTFRERAWASAPPGFSEHATGYVVDFGTRDRNGCPDAEACFAATPVGRWIIAHAAEFGFEQSFPAGNKQQVKWEPWHWRWVGRTPNAPGAAVPRALFAPAAARFPAFPNRPEDKRLRAPAAPVQPQAAAPAPQG